MAMTSPATSPDPSQQHPQQFPPPPPGYGPPYAPYPQPPRRAKKPMSQGKIALITIGGMILAALLVVGFTLLGRSANNDVMKNVQVNCHDGGGIVGAQADVSVTNTSSRSHSYTVRIAFTSADQSTQYATSTAVIRDLEPGQTGTGTATSWQPGKPIGGCKVLRVDRSF